MSKIFMLKSKIHDARVTETELDYDGSITIDKELMDSANLFPFELVHVLNKNNGARFETYVIEGKPGGKEICLNGPASRLAQKGDVLMILSYAMVDVDELSNWEPAIIRLDSENNSL